MGELLLCLSFSDFYNSCFSTILQGLEGFCVRLGERVLDESSVGLA